MIIKMYNIYRIGDVMEKKDKRKKILKVSGIIGLLLLVFGLSYAFFTVVLYGAKKVKISTGNLELQLLDEDDNPIYQVGGRIVESDYAIKLENAIPEKDQDALKREGFNFKLKNTGSIDAKYVIYLDDVPLEEGEHRLEDSYVRYYLKKNDKTTEGSYSSRFIDDLGENPNRRLDEGILDADEENIYTLKVWIVNDADNEAMGKVFNTTLRVEAVQYVPVLKDGSFAKTLYDANEKKFLNTRFKYTSVPGLYSYVDEQSKINYIFRGDVENNYVKFAGSLWRAYRIQPDGSVKLIRTYPLEYENTNYTSGETGTIMVFDENEEDDEREVTYQKLVYRKGTPYLDAGKYIGSNVEAYVNDWYQNTMMAYDDKILLNNYCSDMYKGGSEQVKQRNYEYGINSTMRWGSHKSIFDATYEPRLHCSGDSVVSAKAALITADEIVLAGPNSYNTSSSNGYLEIDADYWSMSPENGKAYMIMWGCLSFYPVDQKYAVVPVVTLKNDVVVSSGNGEIDNPYVIE